MEIAEKYTEANFSLTGEDGAEFFKGVDYFKYLGQVLHREDDEWPEVLGNIRRERQVWGRLGKLLRWEGRIRYYRKSSTRRWPRRCYYLGPIPGCCR